MMKFMNKKLTKKGFTLAELLIVVAIIAVLVAVSIPIFNSQLQKARLATNQANARAAYAAAVAAYLDDDTVVAITYETSTGKSTSVASYTGYTAATSTDISSWDTATFGDTTYDSWAVKIGTSGVTEIAYK